MSESSNTPVSNNVVHSWLKFALVSLIFFQITAATFTSLGVALPFMIDELNWSWSSAGLGFSVLSFMVGIAGRVPAWTLEKYGTRATFGLGGLVMASGLALLATASELNQYLVGAALAGLGYTLCAIVPGVAVINQWLPHRRSFAIGAYMAIGGLGGVAGPLIVTGVVAATDSWRMHWWLMSGSIALLALLAILFLRSPPKQASAEAEPAVYVEKHAASVYATQLDWRFKDVINTPQYYIIVAAMTITLFAGVTANSWAVTHMGKLGIVIAVAAGAMSGQALMNSLSRAFGGLLATRIDPKWLLASALAAEVIGIFALARADNMTAVVLFAIGEGFGFGMCLFSTTILLVNYYGPKEAPKTLGTMHLISTVAMLGPVLGGYAAENLDGFGRVFEVCAALLAICLVAVILMRPPQLPAASGVEHPQ